MTFATTYCSHLDLCSKDEKNLQQSRNENRTNVQSLSSAEKKNLARKDEPVAMVASPVLKKTPMHQRTYSNYLGKTLPGGSFKWKTPFHMLFFRIEGLRYVSLDPLVDSGS